MEITLSNGYTCNVRQLGLFELDNVPRPDLSPFTYKMVTVTGHEFDVVHDITRYSEPPKKPDINPSDIKENSTEYHDLREWEIYVSAVSHEELMKDRVSAYIISIVDYIVENCTDDSHELRRNIIDYRDAEIVLWEAILEPVTIEMIQTALRDTYQASYEQKDIIEALGEVEGGQGIYNALRVWENRLMIEMNMSELEYILMPAKERCRKICAMMIDKWLEYLEAHAAIKKRALEV